MRCNIGNEKVISLLFRGEWEGGYAEETPGKEEWVGPAQEEWDTPPGFKLKGK